MAVRRESDGDVAARQMSGHRAYWSGEAFDVRKDRDWCEGWIAAASTARVKAQEAEPLIAHRAAIADAMREAFAAFKQAEGVSKLRPGDRSRMHSAAVKIGAALPYVEGSDRPRPRRA